MDKEEQKSEFYLHLYTSKIYKNIKKWPSEDQTKIDQVLRSKLLKLYFKMLRDETGEYIPDQQQYNRHFKVIPTNEWFDIIYETHSEVGHNDAEEIIRKISQGTPYVIPPVAIRFYVYEICPDCYSNGRSLIKKALVKIMPCHNRQISVLCYMDANTKYTILRPLMGIQDEILLECYNIFTDFGMPNILGCYDKAVEASMDELKISFPLFQSEIQCKSGIALYYDDILKETHEKLSSNIVTLKNWPVCLYQVQATFNNLCERGANYKELFLK